MRGYSTGDRLNERRANETQQYTQDVESYCRNYIHREQCLRIEVFTFDYLRLDKPMTYRVFDDDQQTILTTEMMRRNLLYRLNNWRIYFDGAIGTDVKFLNNIIIHVETLEKFFWISATIVRQTIRYCIRVMFVHGNSPEYNYKLMSHMFVYRMEVDSNINGVVRLCPLSDDSDNYLYPIFFKKKKPARRVSALKCMREPVSCEHLRLSQ